MSALLAELALPRVVLVVGTAPQVGATTAAAALAATVTARGSSVHYVKVVQTGAPPGGTGDADVVRALGGVEADELARLGDPLPADLAAARAGVTLPPVGRQALAALQLADGSGADVLLVEGSGGLLARLDSRGGTLVDLGIALRYKGISTGVVVVTSPGAGGLDTTSLVVEALGRRELPVVAVVVGSWPRRPGLGEESTLTQLPTAAGAPLLGALPESVGSLAPEDFRAAAPRWLDG